MADKDIEQALYGVMGRHHALPTREITMDIIQHPQRDPGCFHRGPELLDPYVDTHEHALLVFDRDWEGRPLDAAHDLEADVQRRLEGRWGDRARCVVIDPEVEVWAWSDSPEVDTAMGWLGAEPSLREWLRRVDLLAPGEVKPADPKRAFDRALREVGIPASSAVFREIAENVSLNRCQDASFARLRATLVEWFGA